VLAHEFTHALVRDLASRGVPTWLNEGLAAALESDDLSSAEGRLRRAGRTMSLATLHASFGRLNGEDAALAYASSAVAVRRLIDEMGGFAIAILLRDLGEGADFDSAFAHRMHRSFSEFVASPGK